VAVYPPSLSAILCTYNRAELLSQTLESILGQTLDRSNFELIVIDDGSSDHTRQVVESFEGRLPLRYAYQANAGLASAKNHGIYCSQAPLLLFLDDDDVCSPNLFEEHLKTHGEYPDNHFAVLGYTYLDPTLAHKPLLRYVTEVGYLFFYPSLEDGNVLDYPYFWGGRSSCKREFLIAHGVFNPVFRFGCEDIELGYRLSRHNLKVVYNAQAVSRMIRDISFDAFCARLIRQGESQYVFSQLHPTTEVQSWTEMVGADEEWENIKPAYEMIVHSARELDRIANLKLDLGLEFDDLTKNLLDRAYRIAFRACKLKGIYNRRSKALKAESNGSANPAINMLTDGFREEAKSAHVIVNDSKQVSPSIVNSQDEVADVSELKLFKDIMESPPKIHGGGTITWGLGEDVLRFMFKYLNRGLKTLETGCGTSTLVFALKQTAHFVITPSTDEMERIKQYCVEKEMPTERLSFRIGKSEDVLPRFEINDFDLVLIDGCHAFPVPFLDWYYTAEKLKVNGLLIVDDIQLWPCRILCEFLMREPEWAVASTFARSVALRKLKNIPAKEWTDQPFVVEHSN
jgi:Glycosyl transferase family 2/Methyltransferase domain